MKIGSKIKYHRTNKEMTQEELAQGIISVSYLSKIENNQVETGIDIICLLCERLDISPDLPVDSEIPVRCMDFFKSLLFRDLEKADSLFEKLKGEIESISHYGFLKLFEIQKIRYFLLKEDVVSLKNQINLVKRHRYHFTKVEEYYWLKYMANFYYIESDYSEAFKHYKKAEKILNFEVDDFEEEESDLNYSLSLSASKLWDTYLSINYAQKSLEYYQRKYNIHRCIECHILLGISYGRNKEYEKSVNSYKLAKELSSTISSKKLMALCEQNIGHLLSLQGKPEEAITHFLACFNNRNLSDKAILNPVFSLVKEFYSSGSKEKAKKWLIKGQEIIESLGLHKSPHHLNFQVYSYLISNCQDGFEEFMLKKVIPYYESKDSKMELAKNLRILADYYYQNRKYKNSSKYYNQAYLVLESL